ncbi:hypothetical protein [Brevibacillus sp. NRS-1366]|uniref:golvesin C-terminal-like domain-containing protein n=1 Tax=Brevibacillus sp. NRS-1366 TaxID=3233899 RepID=UPI003D2147C9
MKKGAFWGFAFTLAISGALAFAEGASAKICDNDPTSSSGCSQSYYGTWSFQSSQSGSYNSDHRLSRSGASVNDFYVWKFPTLSSGRATLEVYLGSSKFTNREADYQALSEGWQEFEYVGSVNQYSAPSGWNTVGNIYLDNAKAQVMVTGKDYSGASSTQTGADAVSL